MLLTRIPEHFGYLHLQMGRIWHLPRRQPRQTRIRLVRFLDNPLQPLRRCATLLPSRGNIPISIRKHHRAPRSPKPSRPRSRHRRLQPHRLRPPPRLQNPIRLVPRRPPALRPAPRQPPPLHQNRLGILRRVRHVEICPVRDPGKRGQVAQRDEH